MVALTKLYFYPLSLLNLLSLFGLVNLLSLFDLLSLLGLFDLVKDTRLSADTDEPYESWLTVREDFKNWSQSTTTSCERFNLPDQNTKLFDVQFVNLFVVFI